MIERTFVDVHELKLEQANGESYHLSHGLFNSVGWSDLLKSRRVLIISESGTGKTYECREQAKTLWNKGEPAFFLELTALASEDPRMQLDTAEEKRLDAWLVSESDTATFFLDSIDELLLNVTTFERALKMLEKCIGDHLGRTRIVITTRPIPIDEELLRATLPIPTLSSPSAMVFAKAAIGGRLIKTRENEVIPEWRVVGITPLTDEQIIQFASEQGVEDSELLLQNLFSFNAVEFARRPEDLIELCADWNKHKTIRTHRDQVYSNVKRKLSQRYNRSDPADISPDRALEGARKLALAMQLTRQWTIRHNQSADTYSGTVALDPANILPDWTMSERKALLETALFSFATYGRVRFHHRSAHEFLAAMQLAALKNSGMSISSLKRLLFANAKNKDFVLPSKRAIAAWMALSDQDVYESVLKIDPMLLLAEGDPGSLSVSKQKEVLRAYVSRYADQTPRWLEDPEIPVHRVASPGIAVEAASLWSKDIKNSKVRETLLSLMAVGTPPEECLNIAYDITSNKEIRNNERLLAMDVLITTSDPKLKDIALAVSTGCDTWSEQLSVSVAARLFPNAMSIEQFVQFFCKNSSNDSGRSDYFTHLINTKNLGEKELIFVRDSILTQALENITWNATRLRIESSARNLHGALAAACNHAFERDKIFVDSEWLKASIVASRLYDNQLDESQVQVKAIDNLAGHIKNLDASKNRNIFGIADDLVTPLHNPIDSWARFSAAIPYEGPIRLNVDRDLSWLKMELQNETHSDSKRAFLLEAIVRMEKIQDWDKHVDDLRSLVSDLPALVQRIDQYLSPESDSEAEWKAQQAKREQQRQGKEQEKISNWVSIWNEVIEYPDIAFSSTNERNTATRLWDAMRKDPEHVHTSGWNRRFFEQHFGKETADRLRESLMRLWRKEERPALNSEISSREDHRQLGWGLSAIYAESEDTSWAARLDHDQACKAACYSLQDHNGLPPWIEQLVQYHPQSIDETLGQELSNELKQPPDPHGYSAVLSSLPYSSPLAAAFFTHRLPSWFQADGDSIEVGSSDRGMSSRVETVCTVLLKYGDKDAHTNLLNIAKKRLKQELPIELKLVWLSTLIQLDPDSGITCLESIIGDAQPAKTSEAVSMIAQLFGDVPGHNGIDLSGITPSLLQKLLRITYAQVRIEDDAPRRYDFYTPDMRDEAEQGRSKIVDALLNATGEEGWKAKLEMAEDPNCAHFRHRIVAIAEEKLAGEVDCNPLSEDQAKAINSVGEAPPSSNRDMFGIMRDRLMDLDHLLLRDDSPREAWAGIDQERVMRREVSRTLNECSNGAYIIVQESVTADEKETDIRLQSKVSNCEAVIELKIGDDRSATDLRNTISEQLVRKYMGPVGRQSGALLLTISKTRQWQHPDDRKQMISVEQLVTVLKAEAERVEQTLGHEARLYVHLLDLRPRIPLEKDS